MLTITRTRDLPTLLISDIIKIHVIQIEGGQVKLSIDAPEDVKILRGELRWRQSKAQ